VKQRKAIPRAGIKEELGEEFEEQSADLFDLISDTAPADHIDGIVIGTVAALGEAGEPVVDFLENPRSQPVAARSVVDIAADHIGREVALMFEGGNPSAPIALGLIHQPTRRPTLEAHVNKERVVIEARREIELRCGAASIVLTRDGKVRIRGKDLLSRSSGGNRIKGGSVRIN